MNTKHTLAAVLTGTVGLACFLVLIGCETASTNADVAVIVVEPEVSYIEGAGTGVLLKASAQAFAPDDAGQPIGTTNKLEGLYLPLEWRVSDTSLGLIAETVANSAVYVSLGPQGANVITVRDQAGNEGIAIVNQM